MSAADRVYSFGLGTNHADATQAAVGGKGWHLIRMAAAGFTVPPGFVFGTGYCRRYFQNGGTLSKGFRQELATGIGALEQATGLQFGGARRPLLVSVRSGAAASMPGMLDTVLNIGLSRAVESGVVRATGLPRQFWDSYARLVRSFATTVHGMPAAEFDRVRDEVVTRRAVGSEYALDTHGCLDLAGRYEAEYERQLGRPFPDDPYDQLEAAAEAVLRSWRGQRAMTYRTLNGIDEATGTAVIVQAMVFGNRGATSGTGVAFTRNPATGEPGLYLDYVADAQGDDLVSGRRTVYGVEHLRRAQPRLLQELGEVATALEREFQDVQDFEFTVEEGRLWLLQSRPAKRTPWAAVRIAADQCREGLIDREAARARLAKVDLGSVRRQRLAAAEAAVPLGRAIPASPGIASGPIVFAADRVQGAEGPRPILVRRETSTDDLAGMAAAGGILTAVGSRTSHAAVVARQLGRVCLVGCGELTIDAERRTGRLGDRPLHEGDVLTLDGETGLIYAGELPVVVERPLADLAELGLDEVAVG